MYVVFPVPASVERLVTGRGWLRKGVPLLKELVGLAGDRVYIYPDHVEINHERIGPVFQTDRFGAPLPQRPGCFDVPKDAFFAASASFDQSFDGRYFGALPLSLVVGEARPVWIY